VIRSGEFPVIAHIDTRLIRADTVVFLDLPRRVCLWRLLRRHNRRRADYPGGVREGVGWLFILARWILRYPSQKRPAIEFAIAGHCPADTTVIRLRSRRQVTDFLRTLERDKPDSR
jgi:adenylate kinase family enzyme